MSLLAFGEALRQRDGQVIPAAEDLASILFGKHAALGNCDHALVGLWDKLLKVSSEMDSRRMGTTPSREHTGRVLPSLLLRKVASM
jgi:hypothetical protein